MRERPRFGMPARTVGGTRPVRRIGVVSLVALSLLGLAGCANSVGAVKLDTIPAGLTSEIDLLDSRPTVVWDGGDDAWLVLTFGSSSCPTEPRELISNPDVSFQLRLESSGGPVCTADLGATAYRMPSPLKNGTPVTIDLGPGTRVEL